MRVQHVRAWPADGRAVALTRATGRMSDALEALITDIARRFADGVLEAVCTASLTELVEARRDLTPVRAERGALPSAPGRKTNAVPPSPVGKNADAIALAVREAGAAGMQAGGLSAALGFTKSTFNAAIRRAVETGLVRREGTKRGTRYFGVEA
jgi:hypothetical protein